VCTTCNTRCAACEGEGYIDVCSQCTPGYFKTYQGFTCDVSCAVGTYPDGASNECLRCHYSCNTCSGPNADDCDTCQSGYYKREGLCVTACNGGEFIVNNECRTCDSKCSSCFGVEDYECYGCVEDTSDYVGYFFYNYTCMEECPDGYYGDQFDLQCKPCKQNCETCTSYDWCTSCVYGPYQLNQGECTYFSCLDTQYRTIRPFLQCYDCDSSCLTCQGESSIDCLSCLDSHQLIGMTCMTCDDQPGFKEP